MPSPIQPPNSSQAEQSVLGGICLRNSVLDDLAGELSASDFYQLDHQLMFESVVQMHEKKMPIDFVTLSEYLRERGQLEDVGGLAYIGTIAGDCPSASNVMAYAKVIRERSILRSLIAAGQEIGALGYESDGRTAAELVELAEQTVFAIRGNIKSSVEGVSYGAVLDRVRAQMDRNRLCGGAVIGLSTGLGGLDMQTGGLQDTDLIILAGRPSMGKSMLAQNIADHVALSRSKRTAIFSMEMSAEQIGFRALANRASIPLDILRSGNLTDEQADRAAWAERDLRRCQMIIDETGNLSPMTLRAKARKYAKQGGLGLIVVDYIQLMSIPGSKENRTNDVSEISRSLKAMAKELRVPVIAVSQLSRKVEDRQNKRPIMSDLRESGSIEQDADVIIFIYRDEVYNKQSGDTGTAELLVEKQRHGPLGVVRVDFDGPHQRVSNLPQDWRPQAPEPTEMPAPVKPSRGFGRSQPAAHWSGS